MRKSIKTIPNYKNVTVFIKFVDFSNEKQKIVENHTKIIFFLSLVFSIAKFGIPSLDTSSYPI
jgi:hypothetical protein